MLFTWREGLADCLPVDISVLLDLWEEGCESKVAALLGFDEERFIRGCCDLGIKAFNAMKEELHLICVSHPSYRGYQVYRRMVDIERLIRWELGDKRKLQPEEWS